MEFKDVADYEYVMYDGELYQKINHIQIQNIEHGYRRSLHGHIEMQSLRGPDGEPALELPVQMRRGETSKDSDNEIGDRLAKDGEIKDPKKAKAYEGDRQAWATGGSK